MVSSRSVAGGVDIDLGGWFEEILRLPGGRCGVFWGSDGGSDGRGAGQVVRLKVGPCPFL